MKPVIAGPGRLSGRPGPLVSARALRARTLRLALALLAALLLGAAAAAQGQPWELRLCAEPANLPFSNRAGEGFENRIAELLAAELGAELSYVWLPRPVGRSRDVLLRSGECDAVMGITDGHEGFLTTIAYYRSLPVFVYRKDAPFEIGSFDDPILRDLEIGVLGGGSIDLGRTALAQRGLIENQVSFDPDYDRPDPFSAPVDAVTEGAVDVAVVWGPVGGYAAAQGEALEVVPVRPLVDPPFVSMVVPIAIGVRPGDEALRDQLSAALARRWDEVQGVLEEFAVPREPLPNPAAGTAAGGGSDDRLRIGFVLPTPTGSIPVTPDGQEMAAEAARMGAVMAAEELDYLASQLGRELDVLLSSAPSPEAARRAGERLLANGAFALVGGFGEDQARALSEAAARRGALFLNIGSPADALRGDACHRGTFHVEASNAMYLAALTSWLVDSGHRRWFVVHSAAAEPGQQALEALARRSAGAEVVGSAAVAGMPDYLPAMQAIREAGADAVLLLLDWREQIEFLSLYQAFGLDPAITGLAYPVTQTRGFFEAWRDLAPALAPRAALWEATLDTPEARELNARFQRRWGVPMDAPAWAAYEAAGILFEAATSTASLDADTLVRYLESPSARFDIAKGAAASFRPSDHQLRQSLFVLELDPEAEEPLELAAVAAELPASELAAAEPPGRSDEPGSSTRASACAAAGGGASEAARRSPGR